MGYKDKYKDIRNMLFYENFYSKIISVKNTPEVSIYTSYDNIPWLNVDENIQLIPSVVIEVKLLKYVILIKTP